MKNLSIMIKPASSLCNMRCKYCFYADVSDMRQVRSFGVMTHDTAIHLLENVFADLDAGDSLTITFQGGEPTVAGLDFFRFFVAAAEERKGRVKLSWALQTNGLLLDEAWCRFLREHGFLVGLSLDCDAQYHDSIRVDAAGKGTFTRVKQAMKLLWKHGVEFNVLTVLTNSLARHPKQVWNFIVKNDIRFLQLIPCLAGLEAGGDEKYALTPQRFASFYIDLFNLWYEEFSRDNYYSIKLFDDIVNLLAYGLRTACGITGSCTAQLVVESDGSTYPCDFYVLDEYKSGDLTKQPLKEVYVSSANRSFVSFNPTLPQMCAQCPYCRICGGGCKRMRRNICFNEKGEFCGYRQFLDATIDRLAQIAQQQRMMNSSSQV